MKTEGKGKLLRIYVDETHKCHHEPLYDVIVNMAKKHGIMGITVLKGIEGFGTSGKIHTKNIEVLSCSLPVVIEIADTSEKINEIMKALEPIISEGVMVITNEVDVVRFTKE